MITVAEMVEHEEEHKIPHMTSASRSDRAGHTAGSKPQLAQGGEQAPARVPRKLDPPPAAIGRLLIKNNP